MKLIDFDFPNQRPFFLISGNCVVESEQSAIDTAGYLKEITNKLEIPFINVSILLIVNDMANINIIIDMVTVCSLNNIVKKAKSGLIFEFFEYYPKEFVQ